MFPVFALSPFEAEALFVSRTQNIPITQSIQPQQSFFGGVLPDTAARLISGRQPDTVTAALIIQQRGASQLERTIASLHLHSQSFLIGAPNPANEALQFLKAVPQYLPAPKAAKSDTGMITLFWDIEGFYADIEFNGDGKFSVFTRNRSGDSTVDDVLDGHPLEQAASKWLTNYMSPLFPALSEVA